MQTQTRTKATEAAYRRQAQGTHTLTDLARIVADVRDWTPRPGGYIKTADDKTLAQGWEDLARRLYARRVIVTAPSGRTVIDWSRTR